MNNQLTIGDLLTIARAKIDYIDANIICAAALNCSRVALLTRNAELVGSAVQQRFNKLLSARIAGEPIAYLVGYREFYGYRFLVSKDVLIPRPETELLVDQALQFLRKRQLVDEQSAPKQLVSSTTNTYSKNNEAEKSSLRVLDLGTGSGAIAISIAAEIGSRCANLTIVATDQSQTALAIAQRNIDSVLTTRANDGYPQVVLKKGDWYNALTNDIEKANAFVANNINDATPCGSELFDLIVSNPPYIAAHDKHLRNGDLRFEPLSALSDNADGLSAIKKIISKAPKYLRENGALWIEHGYDQGNAVRKQFFIRGFKNVETIRDIAGLERISGGIWHTE